MRRLLASLGLLSLVFLATPARAQHYSFVVTGDGRSDPVARPGMDEDGMNKAVMTELVTEILRISPKFVLYNGDLVFGYAKEKDQFLHQLSAWLEIMKPVYQAGVHVYPVRGNHDASSTSADEVWNQVFSRSYALPDNGPPGEKNMTFAAKEENALVIGLDEYGIHPHLVNVQWLRNQLDQNDLPLVFVVGHEMAFRAGHHQDNLDNNVSARDDFIHTLRKAKAWIYFAGHDHFYDHQGISDPDDHGDPMVQIHQFVVGTAGAPFYQGQDYGGNNGLWNVTHFKHIELTYGYMLGKVDGTKVSLYFMGRVAPGVYEPLDTYSYTGNAGRAADGSPGR